jgi:hypothetical protein
MGGAVCLAMATRDRSEDGRCRHGLVSLSTTASPQPCLGWAALMGEPFALSYRTGRCNDLAYGDESSKASKRDNTATQYTSSMTARERHDFELEPVGPVRLFRYVIHLNDFLMLADRDRMRIVQRHCLDKEEGMKEDSDRCRCA